MKAILVGALVAAVPVAALDLRLIDGRQFSGVHSATRTSENEVKIIHSHGVITLSAGALTRADYLEWFSPLPLVTKEVAAVTHLPAAAVTDYAGRDYSTRSLAERDYTSRSYSPSSARTTDKPRTQRVSGYTRGDGTTVAPYMRSRRSVRF